MNIFVLNRNEEVVQVLSDSADKSACHFFNSKLVVELNKGTNLTFEVDASQEEVLEHLKEENYIVVPYGSKYKLLIIREVLDIHEDSLTKEIYCEDASVELADEVILKEFTGKLEIIDVLKDILQGTRWTSGVVDDTYIRSINEEYKTKSVLDGIYTLASEYDVEVEFSVEFVGNKITARKVNIKKAFGRTLGKRFESSKDISSLKRTVQTGDIKTAIIPFGKTDEETGEALTIKNIKWEKPTNPMDKPLNQTFLEDKEATELWGYAGADGNKRPRWFIVTFEEVEDENELISLAHLQLKRMIAPKITYEVEALDLFRILGEEASHEEVRLGDLVNIIDHEFKPALTLSSRVVKIEHDLNNPANTKFTLGNVVESIVDKDLKTQLQELNYKVGAIQQTNIDLSDVEDRLDNIETNISSGRFEHINELNNLLFGQSLGYHYIEGENGLWIYDKPKDQKPTKVVAIKGGMIGLGQWDSQLQQWKIGTFIDGTNVNASMITTGTLHADRIEAGTIEVNKLTVALQSKIKDIDDKASFTYVDTQIKTAVDSIELSVSSKYSTKEETSTAKADAVKEANKILNDTLPTIYEEASADAQEKVDAVKKDLSDAISNKANLKDVYTKTETYTKNETDSAIKVAKESIELAVSTDYETKTNVETKISTAVNNVQIGGRNLIRNSNFTSTSSNWSNWGSPSIREYVTSNNKKWCHIKGSGTANYQGIQQNTGILVEKNTKYTFSARVKGGSANQVFTVGIHWNNSANTILAQSWQNFTVSTTEQVVSITFTSPSNDISRFNIMLGVNHASTVYDVYFTDIQLEKGTKASDWSLAPEDIQASINTKANSTDVYTKTETYTKNETDSAIKVAKDNINLSVSQTYETKSSVSTQVNGALTSAKSYADTKKTEAINSANSTTDTKLKEYSTTTQMNSAINLAKDSINLSVSNTYETKTNVDNKVSTAVNNIQIGGKNLAKNTKTLSGMSGVANTSGNWYNNTKDGDFNKLTINTTSTSWIECQMPIYPAYNSLVNDVTISFDYKSSGNVLYFSVGAYNSSGGRVTEITNISVQSSFKKIALANGWYRAYYTLKLTSINNNSSATAYKLQFKKGSGVSGSVEVKRIMFEEGNKPTDWTPAPEDIDSSINSLTSRVSTAETKITDSAIVSTVTNSTTYKNDLNGKVSTDKIVSSINQTAESIKIQANKIQLEGTTTIAGSSGDKIRINNADYEILNGSTSKAFFGLRQIDDNRLVPRLALSHSGLNATNNNYFVMTAHDRTNNPLGTSSSYVDLAYRCQEFKLSDNTGDVSNIRMISNGDIQLSALREVVVRSNYKNGAYVNTGAEYDIGKFSSSGSSYFDGNLQIDCVRNIVDREHGLVLADYGKGSDKATVIRIATDSSGTKFVRPVDTKKDIRLGSPSNAWYNIYTSVGTYSSEGIISNDIGILENRNSDDVLGGITFKETKSLNEDASLQMDVTNILNTCYVEKDSEDGETYINLHEMVKLLIYEVKKLKDEKETLKKDLEKLKECLK